MNLQKRQPSAEIPTSSMADIAFLLIIFFMVTAVFAGTHGLALTLPHVEEDDPEPEPATVVQVTTGGILVDCVSVGLEEMVEAVDTSRSVVLYTHPEVDYVRMVEVYDRLTAAGMDDLQVPTRSDIEDYLETFGVNPLVQACR